MGLTIHSHTALIQSYLDCQRELTHFLVRRTGSFSLTGDLVHDLYLKLCHLREPVIITNQRAYLFSMAANLATDHARVENRRRQILEEEGGLMWTQNCERGPEHEAFINAELHFVIAALATLSERTRKVLYLSCYEGKYQADIAAELGISISTVFNDLKRSTAAIAQAKKHFAGEALEPAC
ncbi:RNA polymerase sigma factor [Oceanisphaera avium]|uniref:RNA polymerase sigma factor 70 region 4 type 2 domain-containing protein n=1 Tax=Oceanisphaera avium TaxID=1903694 RepID=A0A1Y0CWJ5_9GAMM|nr:RNA polymerase sigma factor [Oceanisphaera avium]ART79682.1 hypothetical protein CBP12_05550 [Oceanisphaera avium]